MWKLVREFFVNDPESPDSRVYHMESCMTVREARQVKLPNGKLPYYVFRMGTKLVAEERCY